MFKLSKASYKKISLRLLKNSLINNIHQERYILSTCSTYYPHWKQVYVHDPHLMQLTLWWHGLK